MSRGFDAKEMSRGLSRLAVFRPLLRQPVLAGLLRVLAGEGQGAAHTEAYCDFVAEVYRAGGDLGSWLLQQVLACENPVVRLRAAGKTETPEMAESMVRELGVFSALSALRPAEVAALVGGPGELPLFANTPYDFGRIYTGRLAEAPTKGYGMFAQYHMFTLGAEGELQPVKNPDQQRLEELAGYDTERETVVLNTRALLGGLSASNILLYGDAGTGKSSTVKAVANRFCAEGLRLVEVRKNQLYRIPALMDELAENPLKFILFIDDLSFPADDGDFTALKAILEGNVSARPGNIVVYATSNRRHMVRSTFSARSGDEVHLADTLEEEASLSARFGLVVTFQKPDRDLYIEIVKSLAAEYSLALAGEELAARAEKHAIRNGGRSPRTARQFVEMELAKRKLQGEDA